MSRACFKWYTENMQKAINITYTKSIAKKYAGLTGVVYKNKVIAGGNDSVEALKNAQKKFPRLKREDVGMMTLPPRSGIWVL